MKRTGPLQSRQPGYKALGNDYVCFLLYCGTLLAVGSQRVGWLRGSELAFLCVHEVAIAEEGGKPPLLSTRGGFFFFNLSSDTAAWSLEVSCLAKIGFLGHFYRDQRFRVVGPQ